MNGENKNFQNFKIINAFHQTKQKGFSLLEVMIAMTIFAMFITAYISSEGTNVADSNLIKKDEILARLCETKLNTIILNPPQLNESITLAPETGTFEETGYANYTYEIKYAKFSIPDLSKIQGKSDEEGDGNSDNGDQGDQGDNEGDANANGEAGGGDNQKGGMQNKIFEIMKKNLEVLVWQVEVTVKEKNTDYPYSLTSLIINQKATIKVGF